MPGQARWRALRPPAARGARCGRNPNTRDRGESHVAARPDDPHGYLAAVGDQYLVQVGRTRGSAPVIVAAIHVVACTTTAGTMLTKTSPNKIRPRPTPMTRSTSRRSPPRRSVDTLAARHAGEHRNAHDCQSARSPSSPAATWIPKTLMGPAPVKPRTTSPRMNNGSARMMSTARMITSSTQVVT